MEFLAGFMLGMVALFVLFLVLGTWLKDEL